MPFGRRSKCFLIKQSGFVTDFTGAEGVDHDRGWLGNADGVGNLHQAACRQAGGNDVLGDITASVGGGTVNLGRILAGESTATVRCRTAVGVDDDLAASQAAVTLRAADDKTTGRVDQET
jgi:hypothetical protein